MNQNQTIKTWDKIAELYEEKFMDLDLYNETYKTFCDLLPEKASILELGSGPGNITKHLLELKPQIQILATDVSENMVRLAQKNNPNAQVQVLDCRDLNTIQDQFEGIVCGFTLPYLNPKEVAQLIADAGRLLKEKGIFYLSFVPGNPNKSGIQTSSSGDQIYFHYHEEKNIQKELKSRGLKVLQTIKKQYKKTDGTNETHLIILTKKQTK